MRFPLDQAGTRGDAAKELSFVNSEPDVRVVLSAARFLGLVIGRVWARPAAPRRGRFD